MLVLYLASAAGVGCAGDPGMLSASGFELADVPTATTQPPGKVLNFAITAGAADGSVDGTFDPGPGGEHLRGAMHDEYERCGGTGFPAR